MLEKLKITHNTQEWLNFRKSGIGGSDAAAILGKNPYKSNVQVWEEKALGKIKELHENEHIKYGKSAEDLLVKLFALDYPEYTVKIDKNTVYKRDFMFASLDGELTEKKTGKRGVLEIKTSEIYSGLDLQKWDRQIPQNYYIQILHYLIVTGWDFAVLKAQIRGKGVNGEIELITRHYRYDREDVKADLKYLYEREFKFWENVKNGIRPPLILPSISKK